MEENEALTNAFDKLSEMLSTADGQKQISDILSMFSGEGEENPASQGESVEEESPRQKSSSQSLGFSFPDLDSDMLSKAKKLMGASAKGGKNSKNTAILEALKPFLKKERRKKLDGAIQLIGYAGLFKELGLFTKGGD